MFIIGTYIGFTTSATSSDQFAHFTFQDIDMRRPDLVSICRSVETAFGRAMPTVVFKTRLTVDSNLFEADGRKKNLGPR